MAIKWIRIVFCLLCYFITFQVNPVRGQDILSLHYGVEDGLPSNTVYEVYRDHKGYLWFATDHGIARYNGVKFETFSTFDGLPDNDIFQFHEDNYGRLWMAAYNGELCYFKDDVFHTAENTPFLRLPFKSSGAPDILVQSDSTITIAFEDRNVFVNIGLDRVQIISLKKMTDMGYIPLSSRRKLNSNRYELFVNRKGEVQYEILTLDTNANILNRKKVQESSDKDAIFLGARKLNAQDQHFEMIYGYLFSEDIKVFSKIDASFMQSNLLNAVYVNGADTFWATKKGVIVNGKLHLLEDCEASSVTQDMEGNYWISTLNKGCYCISKNYAEYRLLNNVYSSTAKYATFKKNIFFSTANNDFYRLDGYHVSRLFSRRSSYKTDYPANPGFFLDDKYRYYSFYYNENHIIDNVFVSHKAVKHNEKMLFEGYKKILSVNDSIYIQTFQDICFFDRATAEQGRTISLNKLIDSDNPERILCMAKDSRNEVWFGTVKNISKISGTRPIIQQQFKPITFKSFFFLGDYMIGYTFKNKLLVCSNVQADNILVDSSIRENVIWKDFYEIDKNHLLITTNKQDYIFSLYPPGTRPVYTLTPVVNPFVPLKAEQICADSNNCFFFKNGAITVLPVSALYDKGDKPYLFFKTLETQKATYRITGKISLPFVETEMLTVRFGAIAMLAGNIYYQYSLSKDGADSWRDAKNEEISIGHPRYGDYVVKVRAKTEAGDYCDPVAFTLIIERPFWATWWFISLVVLCMAAVIILIVRSRIKYVFNKREKEHETQVRFMKSEYKALNALMNPHFIFNTLNNVQSLYSENNKDVADKYLRIFADIIRQNMHNVSQEMISLQKEMDLVKNYLLLEKLRYEDQVNYVIKVDDDLDMSEIMVPPLLIQPLVENSIKHGILPKKINDGMISVRVYESNAILYIEVKDNGVGIDHAYDHLNTNGHQSFGLDNIKKRISQINAIQDGKFTFDIRTTHDEAGSQTGTTVTITFPLS